MNKNNRTYLLITGTLDRLEKAGERADGLTPDAANEAAMAAVGLLDELRRLRRKWDEQAAANDPRRTPGDFRAHGQWLKRWRFAASRVADVAKDPIVAASLRTAVASVETG